QLAQLPALVERGAEAYGFGGQVWTCKRVAEVIRRTVGVTYHPTHVSRLLHAVRQGVQQPGQRATLRDAAAIPAGWRERWPTWGKKATDEGRTVVWGDHSGFSLLPLAVRTWAPCGQTPIVRVPLTHDQLSAMSGITRDGRLFLHTQDPAYRSPDVVRFLCLLVRTVRGQLLLIWDGSPIPRGQPIKNFLGRGAAKRLHVEPLPGYAPERTPDEGIGH